MDVLMPQLGETVTEGTIISWQRSVGDLVSHGDVLFEVETDKATMEVPATSAGRIVDIRVSAGDTALVGAVVAVITGDTEQATPASTPTGASTTAGSNSMASPLPSAPAAIRPELDPFNAVRSPERNFGRATLPGGVRATPRARRLAAMAGIDLATINADGPHGRIVGKDIEDATLGSSSASPIQTPRRLTTFEQFKAIYDGVPFVEIKLDGMRRTIAKRLLESKQTVPHFYLTVDVDIEQMLAIRQTLNASLPSKLSLNDFVVKAFAMALIRVPLANAVWAEDRILRFARADVGIAIEVDGGLFAPVVRDANNRSLSMIAEEIRALAQRARDRKLKPHDYQGGSATVSNLGKYGVRQFFAIVAPPQSSILAVGASERRPVATVEGGIRISTQMTVTLSCDHRVVDGALGAELLATFKKIIEEPGLTLV